MEAVYTIHVKNMVCPRCILMVRDTLSLLHISSIDVVMGKITVPRQLEAGRQKRLAEGLHNLGLEIIEGRVYQLIEEVKKCVRDYLAMGMEGQQYKLSSFVSSRLAYDFGYLSDLFSKTEGSTVERYFILHRLEKVKELLAHDQYSLTEISFETGFSSVHHLSAQFKKYIGLTPSQYKQKKEIN